MLQRCELHVAERSMSVELVLEFLGHVAIRESRSGFARCGKSKTETIAKYTLRNQRARRAVASWSCSARNSCEKRNQFFDLRNKRRARSTIRPPKIMIVRVR